MTDLVASLGADFKTWEYMQKLIELGSWDNVFLIASEECKTFKCSKNPTFIIVDTKLPLTILTEKVRSELHGKIIDTEAAVNVTLGSGKEHMALISALLKLGLGIRLVAYTSEGVREV